MTVRSFTEIRTLVESNNKSTLVSNETVICLIWKESGFDDGVQNSRSSATGLMQLTKGAVDDVNRNTPKGVHFEHTQMTDAATNIQCGTYYLEIRIKRAGNNVTKGIERFGTGSGYADNIIKCGACILKAVANFTPEAKTTQESCLHIIHP